MLDPLTREMIRQRLAHRMRFFLPCGGHGRFSAFFALRLAFLEVADQQLKLFDLVVHFLRRLAETVTTQQRQLYLQLFDMKGLGVNLGIARLQFGRQESRQNRLSDSWPRVLQ